MSNMAVDIFARTVALASLGNSSGGSYTKAEIDKMFGEAGTVQVEAVDVLPTENIRENVIYLVPNGSSGENYYDECMYINGKWEVIGTTEIDLSNYYTKDEVDNKSIVNIALPKSTFEGGSGNIRQEDYQAFLPLLQFLYNKCRGTERFIRLPLVNINTAHDSSTFYDADNSQLFVVNEQYTKTHNTINVTLDGVPKLDESGVAKYFGLHVTGNIENDNITSIRSVSINKSTIPVANKKYVDDAVGSIGEPVIYVEENSEHKSFVLEEHNPGVYVFKKEPYIKARTSDMMAKYSIPTIDNTIYLSKTPTSDDPEGTIVASYISNDLIPCRLKLSSAYTHGLAIEMSEKRSRFVSIGGIETITGEKTFRYLPKLETEKTPTADLEFVTKKYVDNSLANIDVSFDDVYVVTCGHRFDGGSYNITDDGSIAEMMNTYWPKYLANRNQGGLVIWKDYTGATNGTTLIGYMWGPEIYIQWPWNSQNNGLVSNPYGSVGVVTITGSWDSSTETYTLTRAVWNRTNYVPTKDWNPANKKYVDKSITTAIARVSQFSLLPVDVLPTEDIKTNVIYAVPSDNPKEKDVRIEYVYINNDWEILGTTKIDLSNYYTKEEIDTKDFTANAVIDGGTF